MDLPSTFSFPYLQQRHGRGVDWSHNAIVKVRVRRRKTASEKLHFVTALPLTIATAPSGTQLHAALFLASPANRTTVASRLSGLTLDLSPIMDVNQVQ